MLSIHFTGPVKVRLASQLKLFVYRHDGRTRHIAFLWSRETTVVPVVELPIIVCSELIWGPGAHSRLFTRTKMCNFFHCMGT